MTILIGKFYKMTILIGKFYKVNTLKSKDFCIKKFLKTLYYILNISRTMHVSVIAENVRAISNVELFRKTF